MGEPHINFREMVESLIDEIKKKVEFFFEPGVEKIRQMAIKEQEEIIQKYGTDVEDYKEGLSAYGAAIIIKDIIDSLKRSNKLNKWLFAYNMFTLGEFSVYLLTITGNTDIPLSLMKRHHSLIGKILRNKGWKPKSSAIQTACKIAEKRWLEWKEEEDGPKIFHNKMAENLLEEMPELKEKTITKSMLMRDLKEVAKKIDPSLVRGSNPKKNKKS